MTYEYWFVCGDAIGYVYKLPTGSWVIIFPGRIDIKEPFIFHDRNGLRVDDPIGVIGMLLDVSRMNQYTLEQQELLPTKQGSSTE